MLLKQNNFTLFQTIIGITIFIAAAILSTYFYFTPRQNMFISIFPGLIYTSATVIVFLLMKKITSVLNLFYYYCLMIVTYYVIWILTIYSSYGAFLIGILTAGVGSLVTFLLADKFITRIPFNKRNVFIIGGLSFLITDILLFSWNSIFDKAPIEYIFKLAHSDDTIYGEVIFFWQLFVGTKLVLTLKRMI